MQNIQPDYLYTDEHVWVRKDSDVSVTIGLTDHAQDFLGELVYVELPSVGTALKQGDEACVVESVKTATDVYSPLSGTVVQVNESLQNQPTQINQDPYQKGWLFQITLQDPNELNELLNADAYASLLQSAND